MPVELNKYFDKNTPNVLSNIRGSVQNPQSF